MAGITVFILVNLWFRLGIFGGTKIGISIVIISFNTRDLLRTCLKSTIENIDLSQDEIIVVDNCSSDGSRDMVRNDFPNINLIESDKNKGFSYACNLGFKNASKEFILFSNGDIFYPKNSIKNLYNSLNKSPDVGIISPELVGDRGRLFQMTWGWDISLSGELRQKFFSPRNVSRSPFLRWLVSCLQKRIRTVSIVAGACMLIRRQVLEKIGGFDENFELYFEDADLCLRCRQSGYKVLFDPKIKVVHALGQSGKSTPKKISLIYRQSQIYFYRKHHSPIKIFILKNYLWSKFLFSKAFWKDSQFRNWIKIILREKKKLYLTDPISSESK